METFDATDESKISWSDEPTTEGITIVSPSGGRIRVHMIIVSTFLLTFAAVSAVTNFLVILSYKYEKKLRSNFQILIRNQAAANLLVCTISIPVYTIYMLLGYWPFGRGFCGIFLVLDWGQWCASVYSLVAICVDRLWAIKWCHHYRKYNTRKKTAITCFVVWLSTAIVVGYPVISDLVLITRDSECNVRAEENQEFMTAINVSVIFVPCVFVIASYSVVYHAIRKLRKTRPGDKQASRRHRQVAVSAAPRATQQSRPARVELVGGRKDVPTSRGEYVAGNSRGCATHFTSVGTKCAGKVSRDAHHSGDIKIELTANEGARREHAESIQSTATNSRQKVGGKESSNKGHKQATDYCCPTAGQ